MSEPLAIDSEQLHDAGMPAVTIRDVPDMMIGRIRTEKQRFGLQLDDATLLAWRGADRR